MQTSFVAINELVILLFLQQRYLLIKNAVIFEIHVFKFVFAIVLCIVCYAWLCLDSVNRLMTHNGPTGCPYMFKYISILC